MSTHRIVSLIASATEIVSALGFESQLVGRSHECDYPPSVERLPACSEPKFDVNGTSREIDERVKATLRDAVSVYRVDADLLKRLDPTVVVTQTQCEVCAVSLKDVERAVRDELGPDVRVVACEPMSLADVWTDIQKVGDALDATETAARFIAERKSRLANLSEQIQKLATVEKPTIACIEWIDPLMAAGNWVPELVEIAGGVNLFGKAGKHSPWMTFDDLLAKDPDVIAVMPCGFGIPRTQSEMPTLTDHPDWPRLTAVQQGRVFLTDGNHFFNRPGPRVVESAEILAEMFYPDDVSFGHEGSGWVRLDAHVG